MIRKITQITFAIALIFLATSCQNTQQKMQGYVNSYNSSAAVFSDNIITSTSAKAFLDKNKIEIRIETNLEQNETNKALYGQLFPGILAQMLTKEAESKALIEEGVIFDVYFLAEDYTELAQLKVDKVELEKLLKGKAELTDAEKAKVSDSGVSSEMQEMLLLMNRNMPITNADGSKILKIEVNAKDELLYKIEVPKEYSELLKGDASKALMKEELLRNTNLKNVISSVRKYGVTKIVYEYLDVKGKLLNNIVLTDQDFSNHGR